MGRRKNEVSQLLDIVSEFTKIFWQVGAVATTIFALLAIFTLVKAIEGTQAGDVITTYEAISNLGNFVLYLGSLTLALIAIILGIKTYKSYRSQNIN